VLVCVGRRSPCRAAAATTFALHHAVLAAPTGSVLVAAAGGASHGHSTVPVPGDAFHGPGHLRLCFSVADHSLDKAITRLTRELTHIQGRA